MTPRCVFTPNSLDQQVAQLINSCESWRSLCIYCLGLGFTKPSANQSEAPNDPSINPATVKYRANNPPTPQHCGANCRVPAGQASTSNVGVGD